MQPENRPASLRERLINQPPLMWFSLAFLGGIIIASLITLPLWVWLALFVISLFPPILLQLISKRVPNPFGMGQGRLSALIFPIA